MPVAADMTAMRRDFRSATSHLITSSRKRIRDTDDAEFMPISKKLNNLHLVEEVAPDQSVCSPDSYLTHVPYQPSIPMDQNPVYYEMNRVLYEAHLMRRGRSRTVD